MNILKRTHGGNKSKGKYRLWVWLSFAIGIAVVKFGPQLSEWLIKVDPPSHEVAQLARDATMTPEAQQLFYRQVPVIQPKQTFFKSCQQSGKSDESLIMLGCYRSDSRSGKIFIQAITDVHFDGLMGVIAAHEMLHVAYHKQLSKQEKDWLAPRLKKAARRVQDHHLASVLKQYEITDKERYFNELHSHLGTELDDFGDEELEQHYRRYFADRHVVVALARQSQVALNKLDDRSDQLSLDIQKLEANLKTAKQDLNADKQQLALGQQKLNTLRANLTDFKAQAEQAYFQDKGSSKLDEQYEQMQSNFNQQVLVYNEQVRLHQDKVARFNQQVDDYKQQVNAYNKIIREKRSLLGELSSKPLAK